MHLIPNHKHTKTFSHIYIRTHLLHCWHQSMFTNVCDFARKMFVKEVIQRRIPWTSSFPNLTASHVSKDSLSWRIFPLGKKNKVSKTIYTSYEKHKGINAYWYNITQNIYVLMFEVSWTSEGKSLWRTTTEKNGEACMKYLFPFTISMHDRTITVVVYNDTQIV